MFKHYLSRVPAGIVAVAVFACGFGPSRLVAQVADDPFTMPPPPGEIPADPFAEPPVPGQANPGKPAQPAKPRLEFGLPAPIAVKTGKWQQGDAPGAGAAENADVRALIAEFESPQLAVRKSATEKLIALGPRAMPDVRQAMLSDDAETRARAEAVARGLERKATAHLLRRGVPDTQWLTIGSRPGEGGVPGAQGRIRLDEEDMRQISCLYRTTSLTFANCEVSDELMAYVGRLSSLDELVLASPNTTDAALEKLGTLHSLTKLGIKGTKITGRGLTAFAGVDSLEQISLHECPLTDDSFSEGMRGLSKDTQVRILHVARCPISDAALAAISEIHSLGWLALGRTDVTDRGLPVLSSLPKLMLLNLLETRTTDASVEHLAKFPALRVLLPSENTTASGLRPLSKSQTLEKLVLSHHKLRRSEAVELFKELRPHGIGTYLPSTFLDEKP